MELRHPQFNFGPGIPSQQRCLKAYDVKPQNPLIGRWEGSPTTVTLSLLDRLRGWSCSRI